MSKKINEDSKSGSRKIENNFVQALSSTLQAVATLAFIIYSSQTYASTEVIALIEHLNGQSDEVAEFYIDKNADSKKRFLRFSGSDYVIPFKNARMVVREHPSNPLIKSPSGVTTQNGNFIVTGLNGKDYPVSNLISSCYFDKERKTNFCKSQHTLKYTTSLGEEKSISVLALKRMVLDKALIAEIRTERNKQMLKKNEIEHAKEKTIQAKRITIEETANKYRNTLSIGNNTHCGLVIEIKLPIVKIQTTIGEHWFKLEQLYQPNTMPCIFVNNVYQEP